MRIVIRSVTVGEAADVRSDSEEEEESASKDRKKVEKTRSQRDAKKKQ